MLTAHFIHRDVSALFHDLTRTEPNVSPRPDSILQTRIDLPSIYPARDDANKTRTSGSTGQPMEFWAPKGISYFNQIGTAYIQKLWGLNGMGNAVQMLIHASTKATQWSLYGSGRLHTVPVHESPDHLYLRLREVRAKLLITHPSILKSLDFGRMPSIQYLWTIGEVVDDELRKKVVDAKMSLIDVYSSTEAGIMAATCPKCGYYHSIPKLNNVGTDVSGRILVTSSPRLGQHRLEGYFTGDYGVVVDSKCPYAHPYGITFEKIIGRERQTFLLSKGYRVWPDLHISKIAELLGGAEQVQVAQKTLRGYNVRYAGNKATKDQEKQCKEYLKGCKCINADPAVVFDNVPKQSPIKFLDCISHV